MKYFFDTFNKILISDEIKEGKEYIEYDSENEITLGENEICIYDLITNKPKVLKGQDATNYLISHNLIEFDSNTQYVDEDGNIKEKTNNLLETERLNLLKQQMIYSCNMNAKTKIEAGFEYKEFIYDTKIEDQLNFLGYIELAKVNDEILIRCLRKEENEKKLHLHKSSDVFEVFTEFAKYKREILNKCSEIKSKINACESISDLQEIDIAL